MCRNKPRGNLKKGCVPICPAQWDASQNVITVHTCTETADSSSTQGLLRTCLLESSHIWDCLCGSASLPSQRHPRWHKKHRMHSKASFRLTIPNNSPSKKKFPGSLLNRAELAAAAAFPPLPRHRRPRIQPCPAGILASNRAQPASVLVKAARRSNTNDYLKCALLPSLGC